MNLDLVFADVALELLDQRAIGRSRKSLLEDRLGEDDPQCDGRL